MEIKARYVLIGLFTLFVIIAGFAFVYWLETTGGVGKRTTYEIRFQNNVSGLLTGSAVLFNGIRVGEVTNLRLAPDQPKEVDATIAIDARTPMRADTQVGLEFQGLTGVAVVTLTGGSANAPVLQAPAGRPPLLIASEAAGQSMSESARQVLGRLDRILADNANDIRTLVTNLSSFSEALGKNSGKVDTIFTGLERMTGGGGKATGLVYTLSALPAATPPIKPIEKQLAIPDPSALLTYDSERVLEQRNGDQIAPLGTAKWADSLTKLMQAKIVQSFENNGGTGQVTRPIDGVTPDFQLLTEIRKFQIVTEPERTAQAEITAKLVGNEGRVVAAQTFSASAPVKSDEEADAAKGLNEAFGKMLADLVPWAKDAMASVGGAEQAQPQPQPVPAQPKKRGQARG
jgi:phospholipid/cholesterol/gamma-HCH transport system substrate-binding protein